MDGGQRLRFDRYSVDLRTRELFCGTRRVAVQELPLRLFVALLQRRGEVVTRDELCDALWPRDTHVEREAGLNTAVRKLRHALEEAAGDRDLIETLPRVGYRLRSESRPRAAVAGPLRDVAPTRRHAATAFGLTAAIVATIALLASASGLDPLEGVEPMPATAELRARYVEARGLLAVGDDLERARDLLRSIVQTTPDFVPARAHLAEAGARVALANGRAEDIATAREDARRALRLDPRSAIALRTGAMIALLFDRDVAAAASGLERALAHSPEDPVTYLTVATYESILGRHERALAAVRKAVDLAPEVMSVRSDAGYFLLRAGRYREAIAECEMVLRLAPDQPFGRDCLIRAHGRAGAIEEVVRHALAAQRAHGASEAEQAALRNAPDPYRAYLEWQLDRAMDGPEPAAVQVAGIHQALGDPELALEWLERAAERNALDLVYVPGSVSFAPLQGEPRFDRIVAALGLEPPIG